MRHVRAGFLAAMFFVISVLAPLGTVTAFAETKQVQYRPLDVVLTIDTSGSMKSSDEERLVMQAVQMFTNMMPSTDGRVGIVGFNETATVYSQRNGKPAMLDMNDAGSPQEIRSILEGVKYAGDTASGNGLFAATELLKSEKRDGSSAALILFSDGVDDLNSELKFNESEENLTDALQWCASNGVPIYTVGFNYKLKDGKDSLSGEGMDRLNRISQKTSGFTSEVQDRNSIEDTFVRILAEMCELYYIDLQEIPGDGGTHEIPITVNEGVVEMNIRIACDTSEAIRNDSIQLSGPGGQNIPLENSGTTRFNVEKKSANIKIIKPESGEWKLLLNGITGDNIKIGLLNHYQLGSELDIVVPEGNPDGIAFVNDPVQIIFSLTDDEGRPADSSLYQEVTKATAEVTSRESGKKTKVDLSFDGKSLSGEFVSDGSTVSDIVVSVDSPYFHKQNRGIVTNGNKPLELTGTLLPDQKINVKKTAEISDIFKCVTDAEGDAITAEIKEVSKPSIADVRVDNDRIILEGKKWGSGLVTVQFRDAQGNSVETTFALKVRDPVKMALLAAIPVIIAAIAAAVVITGLLAGSRINGAFEVGPIAMKADNRTSTFGRTMRLRSNALCRGRSTTLRDFMKKVGNRAKTDDRITAEQIQSIDRLFVMSSPGSPLSKAMSGVTFKGTVLGRNGFVLNIPKGSPIFLEGTQPGTPVCRKISGTQVIVLVGQVPDGSAMKVKIQYEQYAVK